MAKLWAIIKREYLERVRSKWFLIATFFGPIFFSAIIIVPAWWRLFWWLDRLSPALSLFLAARLADAARRDLYGPTARV
jgi:hypothetical protein